jgi:Na+/H+ antiporter NhaC
VGKSVVFMESLGFWLQSIPFLFFPLLLVAGAFSLTCSKGFNLEGLQQPVSAVEGARGPIVGATRILGTNFCGRLGTRYSNFLFFSPLIFLSVAILGMMLLTGGFFRHGQLIESLKHALPEASLLLGTLLTLVYTTLLFYLAGRISYADLLFAGKEGFVSMQEALMVLVLAWTFASFLKNDLGTGRFLASMLSPLITPSFLPLMMFLMSALIAFSMGSAWATMALVLPIVVPLVPTFAGFAGVVVLAQVKALLPAVGAVVSGAILGSSLSPISDLLVIVTRSTQVDALAYLKIQARYLLPITTGSAASFALAGFLINTVGYWVAVFVPLVAGFFVAVLLLNLLDAAERWFPFLKV